MNKLKIVVNTFTKKKKLIIHVAVKFFLRELILNVHKNDAFFPTSEKLWLGIDSLRY